MEVVLDGGMVDLRSNLEAKIGRYDRIGRDAERHVILAYPVAQLDGIHLQGPVLGQPREELLFVLASPDYPEVPRIGRLDGEHALYAHLPPLELAVLAESVRGFAPYVKGRPEVTDLARVLEVQPLHGQLLVGEVHTGWRVKEAVVRADERLGLFGGALRNDVHHAPERIRPVQRGVRALHDLHPVDVEHRERVELDRSSHPRQDALAVDEHENAAADAAGQAGGAPDVHLSGVEHDTLDGGLAGARRTPIRGDDDRRHVEHRSLQDDLELRGLVGDDLDPDDGRLREAGSHRSYGVRPRNHTFEAEASLGVGRGVERRPADEDGGTHHGRALVGRSHGAAERTLLRSRRCEGEGHPKDERPHPLSPAWAISTPREPDLSHADCG
jgi:hypothetical protein